MTDKLAAGGRDGKFIGEAWLRGNEIIVGIPFGYTLEAEHNCDQMGCGAWHVLHRFPNCGRAGEGSQAAPPLRFLDGRPMSIAEQAAMQINLNDPFRKPFGPQEAWNVALTQSPRKEYKHFAHCNGDRTVPAGEPGHSCCCFSEGAAAAGSGTFAEGIEAAAKIVDTGLVKWRAKEPVTFQGIAEEIRKLAQEKREPAPDCSECGASPKLEHRYYCSKLEKS